MNGQFPRDYHSIRALAGVGDYTAAAVASIAFDLPHAALDGNVLRVLARLNNEDGDIGSSIVRSRLQEAANSLLDTRAPGEFNQAMMELGATVCLPKEPRCPLCPVSRHCRAQQSGRQAELPVKLRRTTPVNLERALLVVWQNGEILMWRRTDESQKLVGFWELPEPNHLPAASIGSAIGEFRHSITNHNYVVRVFPAVVNRKPLNFEWIGSDDLKKLPLSTTTKKALALFSSRV
jgi:A/G-specific adenine glycosylase